MVGNGHATPTNVYSADLEDDASFEAVVHKEISPDCEIHVFDLNYHATAVAEQTGNSSNVHFHHIMCHSLY